MADIDENIIIIEENEAAGLETEEEKNDNNLPVKEVENNEAKQKKIIIFAGAGLALVLVILIAVLLVVKLSKKDNIPVNDSEISFIEQKLEENREQVIEPSKLENMIAKANQLYATGSKPDALHLYEKIATYSEAISLYNLGVAQLKNKQYQTALSSFKKAINNDEKGCVSSINAAVCSLHLKDKTSFKYYIDLAHAYLPNEIDSPLYSYYYTLINYYNNNYLEALTALKYNPSNEYSDVQKHLKAKISALFGNDYEAIEAMEKEINPMDDFNLALLYARIGDYPLAISYFDEAIKKNKEPIKATLARGLIKLKDGQIQSGSSDIKAISEKFPQDIYNHYPIKVKLKDSLFNSTKAQKHYRDDIQNSRQVTYQKIFYFSPYKVFNPNIAINYIQKGNANMFIDNIKSAQKYLKTSALSSNVNIGIAKAIKKALEFKIRSANKDLQALIKIEPKHSILHYNLALTYAQMGNMIKAQKHFIKSYHLDAKNYLSGIFAVMTSQLIDKKTTKLKSILKDNIMNEDSTEEIELYKALVHILENQHISTIDWLDKTYKERPLYLALDIIISDNLNKMNIAQEASSKLVKLLPNDILPHMMYIDSHFYNLKPTLYANKVLNYLKEQKFNFKDLYFGPNISRNLYIQQNLITGKLYFLRQQLKRALTSTDSDTTEILLALALASFYDRAFEESYTIYNTLIDEFGIRDAHTLFLGAIASIAAKHSANAIALLELSKMKNKKFLESRYALGLLYLEVNNNSGATIQLTKVDKEKFISEYFDFEIDVNKLLFKKQQ